MRIPKPDVILVQNPPAFPDARSSRGWRRGCAARGS